MYQATLRLFPSRAYLPFLLWCLRFGPCCGGNCRSGVKPRPAATPDKVDDQADHRAYAAGRGKIGPVRRLAVRIVVTEVRAALGTTVARGNAFWKNRSTIGTLLNHDLLVRRLIVRKRRRHVGHLHRRRWAAVASARETKRDHLRPLEWRGQSAPVSASAAKETSSRAFAAWRASGPTKAGHSRLWHRRRLAERTEARPDRADVHRRRFRRNLVAFAPARHFRAYVALVGEAEFLKGNEALFPLNLRTIFASSMPMKRA